MTEQRIKDGMDTLDQEYPDWRDKIDLSKLDMGDCLDCILGQLYGEYDDGKLELTKDLLYYDMNMEEWAVEHGFQTEDDEAYTRLTRAWKEALTKP